MLSRRQLKSSFGTSFGVVFWELGNAWACLERGSIKLSLSSHNEFK